jgi:adenylosuccinate synthase
MSVARCINGLRSKLAVVMGGQWGDEGKGKLVDLLSEKYDVCARHNGGANAGHTVVKNGKKYALHLLPCGVLSTKTVNLIGNGVVVHLETMFKELGKLDEAGINYDGRMLLSDRAHLVTAHHIAQDELNEKKQNIGTTKRGIGPTYAAKISRYGLRVGDLKDWNVFTEKYKRLGEFYPQLSTDELPKLKEYRDKVVEKKMIIDGVNWLNQQIKQGKRVLVEGANAALLDIDLGTYPYVTSSNCSIGGVQTGLGISYDKIETVIGVVKAYTTRVGHGPFPTELLDKVGERIREKGHEYGTTTGRPRRCGWLDIPTVRYTHQINGYASINITKLDILDELDEIKIGVGYKINGKEVDTFPSELQEKTEVIYETVPGWKVDTSKVRRKEDLPKNAKLYLEKIEKHVGLKVSWVGTGPAQDAMFTF